MHIEWVVQPKKDQIQPVQQSNIFQHIHENPHIATT